MTGDARIAWLPLCESLIIILALHSGSNRTLITDVSVANQNRWLVQIAKATLRLVLFALERKAILKFAKSEST